MTTDLRPYRTLVGALTGVLVTSFPAVILVASLPEIAVDLGTSESAVAWVVTAPILLSSVLLPILGRVGDVAGHRRLFLVGLAVATATSLLGAFAWDIGSLVVLRSVSQLAGTATHPAALAVLVATYQGAARSKALGYWALVSAGSPAVGLAFGGPIVAAVGWRGIFVVQAVAGLVSLLVARAGLRETAKRAVASFDLMGGVVLMVGVGAVLVGLDRGGHWGWGSPRSLACAVVAVVAGLAFVAVERRSRDPMLPVALLKERGFAMPIAADAVSQAANMGVFFVTPFILYGQFGWDAAGTAVLMLPAPVTMAIFSPIGGRLSWSIGTRRTAVVGSVVLVGSVAAIGLGAAWLSVPVLVAGLVAQGVANGLLRPATSAALSYALEDGLLGVGMATMRMIAQVGTALGITAAVAASGPDDSGGALVACFAIGVVALVAASQLVGGRHEPAPGLDRR